LASIKAYTRLESAPETETPIRPRIPRECTPKGLVWK
jgi:hypothetical protein